MTLTIGSLFSGYCGLDRAVQSVLPARTIWHSDIKPAAVKLLAHRFPDVPNLGDITAVDWATVERPDIVTGGFPCTDISAAGKQAGLIRYGDDKTRSGLWSEMCRAIDHLRPSLVVAENVRAITSVKADSHVEPCPWCLGDPAPDDALRALGAVLGDLADIGYDAAWYGLRASDVGACHGRFRIFITAWPATDTGGEELARRAGLRTAGAGQAEQRRARPRNGGIAAAHADDERRPGYRAGGHGTEQPTTAGDRITAPDASGDEPERRGGLRHLGSPAPRHERTSGERQRVWDAVGDSGATSPDALGFGRNGRAHDQGREPEQRTTATRGGPVAAADADGWGCESGAELDREPLDDPTDRDSRGGHTDGHPGPTNWGAYAAAIRRWELVLGRPAPAPTEPGPKGAQRLSPKLTEWMMGLPEGWVTDVPGLSRADMLSLCGDGVVPQQGAEALRRLLPIMAAERAA